MKDTPIQLETMVYKSVKSKNSVTKIAPFNVQIELQIYYPYCGGAAPTWEMQNNISPASGNYIINQ